jgi:hypothetical protein
MIRPLIADSEELDYLDKIITEEKSHIQHFQEILDSNDFD